MLFSTSFAVPQTDSVYPDRIDGVDEAVVLQYFQSLNAGNFETTSQLFAVDGMLEPPFEAAVIGPTAIAHYLNQEAQGIKLKPLRGTRTLLDNGCVSYEIVGNVQTPWFSVNVCWEMILSPTQEIFVVRVKLLASLQELLHLRQQKQANS